YYCWRFVTRQYIDSDIWNALVLSTILSLGVFFAALADVTSSSNVYFGGVAPILLLVSGPVLIGSLLSLLAMNFSTAIFRWSPVGQGGRLRDRALHIRRKRNVKFTPLNKTYSLSCAGPDK